jgi:hypothetical protein
MNTLKYKAWVDNDGGLGEMVCLDDTHEGEDGWLVGWSISWLIGGYLIYVRQSPVSVFSSVIPISS